MDIVPHQVGTLVEWDAVKSTLYTGDVLLCQTHGAFGMAEEIVTDAPYTHVCVFVRFEADTQGLYVLESAISKKYPDAFTGKTDGPKLIEADLYIHTYLTKESGVLTYRCLRYVYTGKHITMGFRQVVQMYYFLYANCRKEVKYERSLMDLPNSLYRFRANFASDPSSEFCSELVASVWVILGVYIKRVSDKIIPRDFSQVYEDVFDVKHNTGPSKVYLTRECTLTLGYSHKQRKK